MPVPTEIDRLDDANGDPLSALTAPPLNESPAERQIRLKKELEAKVVSDAIDDEINRVKSSRRKKPMKILLLGPSESGKSTTLKNFQLVHNTREFREERASWKSVIHLNIVHSVCLILKAITEEQTSRSHRPQSAASPRRTTSSSSVSSHVSQLNDEHHLLRHRLDELRDVERRLVDRLSVKGETEATKRSEVAVLASSKWKSAVARFRRDIQDNDSAAEQECEKAALDERQEEVEISQIIASLKEDIIQLWNDKVIRSLPSVVKLRLDEHPGFFLDCIDRIADVDYIPSDDDVLKARIKTLGVSEYVFRMERYPVRPEWRVFDVGGSRSQREYWVPYFDDMDSIIFLAPLSCFDQQLAEDTSMNRMEDCFLLWKSLCSNQTLKNCNVILFLNKRDLLERKLASGIQFERFVKTFAGQKNDAETVSRYLRKKFEAYHTQYSPQPRPFYCYVTSLTDTKTTFAILASVTDMVMRRNLHSAALL